MKRICIYYSHSGNGKVVSSKLKEKDIDIREVTPKKELPKSLFGSMMKGGFLATVKHKSKLVDFDNNIEGYEEIIIASPIWNARFSTPINGALSQLDLKDKKVTFVLYSASGEAKKAIKRINKEYAGARVIILKEPKKYPEELSKLDEI